ncbi:hypothetical protein EVAR_22280_1 [Eumeta japonica]|uniref:Uncharacterized protein n=1 Tax=Eumeta variegata TaxID=151549 RepID=A0A4C1UAL6_EUMVA|nr:hypothetical protein EVAR_22280_1 [Eumeta japonica]
MWMRIDSCRSNRFRVSTIEAPAHEEQTHHAAGPCAAAPQTAMFGARGARYLRVCDLRYRTFLSLTLLVARCSSVAVGPAHTADRRHKVRPVAADKDGARKNVRIKKNNFRVHDGALLLLNAQIAILNIVLSVRRLSLNFGNYCAIRRLHADFVLMFIPLRAEPARRGRSRSPVRTNSSSITEIDRHRSRHLELAWRDHGLDDLPGSAVAGSWRGPGWLHCLSSHCCEYTVESKRLQEKVFYVNRVIGHIKRQQRQPRCCSIAIVIPPVCSLIYLLATNMQCRLVPVGDSDQSLPAEMTGKKNGVGIKTNEKRKRKRNRNREEWKRLEEAYVSQDTLINLG